MSIFGNVFLVVFNLIYFYNEGKILTFTENFILYFIEVGEKSDKPVFFKSKLFWFVD